MAYKDESEVARLMAELLNLTGEIGALAVGAHAALSAQQAISSGPGSECSAFRPQALT